MDTLNTSRITYIPATGASETLARMPQEMKVRVAAYCRVSTDNREQESSYEAQVNYFEHFIGGHQNWELVSIYADPGISGKSIKRPEFLRMMKEAREGKIDRILAKSVSRFARNTLDCVACCRELKELGIGVYFEKENIDTMDPSSPFMLTLMASLAEEESRSISSNTKWGMRKKLADGTFKMNCEKMLGFKFDEEGNIEIDEEEAAIVRRIFSDYASGLNPHAIADELTDEEVTNDKYVHVQWYAGTIRSILRNEKYMGDMKLQKTFRPDFLSRTRKNNGEVESYYIENHHKAIIDPKYFKMVQYLIKRDEQLLKTPCKGVKRSMGRQALSGRIFCGECGCQYVMKNQDNKGGAIKTWVCSRHRISKDCPAIPIKEAVFNDALKACFNAILSNKDEHILLCQDYYERIKKTTYDKEEEYRLKIEELKEKIEVLSAETEDFESRLFNARLEEIRIEIQKVKDERDRIIPSYHLRRFKSESAMKMMKYIEENDMVDDDQIQEAIASMIERIIVVDNDMPGESINICLYNGESFNVKLDNPKKRKCKHRVCYREA